MRISDWSSDVCSSDLFRPKISEDAVLDLFILGGGFDDQSGVPELGGVGGQPHAIERRLEVRFGNPALGKLAAEIFLDIRFACLRTLNRDKIGSAVCRERVCQYV